MGPAIFVIAILGCGEGESSCEQVSRLDTRYASQAACSDATAAALERHGDADFPVVIAQCVAGSARPAVAPDEVRLPPAQPARFRQANSPARATG